MSKEIAFEIASRRKTVRLSVVISSETNDLFREFVVLKHNKFERGLLSFEFETAILNYIHAKQSTHTQNHTRDNQEQFKVNQLKEGIILYLHQKYNIENAKGIELKHLNEAISYLKGIDARTVKKWKMALIQFKCIRYGKMEGCSNYYEFL